MNKEEIEKAKIGLWNIRVDCLKIMQCGLSDRQDKEECLKEIDVIDNIFKYIKELEQKESILDKVTDKLKEIRRELDDDGFDYYAQEITEALNIIEGEKKMIIRKCDRCGIKIERNYWTIDIYEKEDNYGMVSTEGGINNFSENIGKILGIKEKYCANCIQEIKEFIKRKKVEK